MRLVKKACVSSSAIPSRWSTQPSRVMLMLKVKSPMATPLLRVGRTAGSSLVHESLEAANAPAHLPAGGRAVDIVEPSCPPVRGSTWFGVWRPPGRVGARLAADARRRHLPELVVVQ